MIVPPPLTFSTMKFCPNFFDNAFATTRASWSVGPPAGYGTMMVTVRFGYSCAETGAAKTNRPRTASATAAMRLMIGSSLCKLLEGSLPLGNDRQQEVWRLVGGKVQRVAAGENLGVPVVRVDMQEGADTFHRVRGIGQRRVGSVHFVVLAADGERE